MNPKLVTWDYGKDINVTLEDAVVSWEELRIIMGGAMYNKTTDEHTVTIYKNAERNFKVGETFTFPMGDGKTIGGKNNFPGADVVKTGFKFKWVDMTHGLRGSGEVDSVTNDGGDPAKYTVTLKTGTKPFADAATEITKIRFFWEEEVVEENVASEIVISPSTFPGTYKVVGDALIRSEANGKDEAFQFIINKAKMLSEVTLTMQAKSLGLLKLRELLEA